MKRGKEEEKNLGEQLLKEFVDFQSARPDKICVQDKTDKCEVPDATSLQSLGLPIEEERTKHQESSNEVEKKLNEESVLTTESKQETASPSPQNTDNNQPLELSADAAGTTITDEHVDRSSLEVERRFQSDAEPKSVPLSSESLPVTPYTNDTNRNKTEQEAERENKRRAIIINSSPTWSVRSNTIPGLQPSKAASEEDTYTITQLAPIKPLDLTSLVSSLCETESDINYSNSTQINSFTNIWEPSTDVTPLSHVQGITEGLDKEGYTIILPTVSSKKEADEQFLALFNESQISEY